MELLQHIRKLDYYIAFIESNSQLLYHPIHRRNVAVAAQAQEQARSTFFQLQIFAVSSLTKVRSCDLV